MSGKWDAEQKLSIIGISQNTEKSPEDVQRLAVTQAPVKRPSATSGGKKFVDLATELKKTVEHAGDDYTNYNWCVWNSN